MAEPEPVSIWIQNISRKGEIYIKFSEELEVPKNVQKFLQLREERQLELAKQNKTRRLGHLAEDQMSAQEEDFSTINFTQIISIDLDVKSEEDKNKFTYEIELVNWTKTYLELQINFTNPTLISSGSFPDVLVCQIKNVSMFKSVKTLQTISNNGTKIFKMMPKQLPVGITEEDVQSAANQVYAVTISLLVFQILF